MARKLYLVDATAYVFRAFHAIRVLNNSKGFPTNALLGFTSMILKVMREEKPDRIVLVFDGPGPTFRDDVYPEYKANRPPVDERLKVQMPYVLEISRAFGLPVVEAQGVEADDVIASLIAKFEPEDFDFVIVSGDKDLMQLVSPRVVMFDGMKDKRYDVGAVTERCGVPPDKLVEVMALTGDTSDNVPGVKGIGEKAATELVGEFGSVEALLARIEEVSKPRWKEILREQAAQARLSRLLVELRRDVPLDVTLESLQPREPDYRKLRELFGQFEFTRFLQSLPAESRLPKAEYRLILDERELRRLVDRLRSSGGFAFDCETTSKSPVDAELVGISLCCQADEAFYVPVAHRYLGVPEQIPSSLVLEQLRPLLEDPQLPKFAQNAKYDLLVLGGSGIRVCGLRCDTMVASYLLNPGKQAHGLADLAREHFDHAVTTYEQVTRRGNEEIRFAEVELEAARDYSCEDVHLAFLLAERLGRRLKEENLWPLFEEIEMPLVEVLADMERHGVLLDRERLKAISEEMGKLLRELRVEIHRMAGVEFNVDSPKQLQEVLFERLGLKPKRKTKTGYSTDVDVLEALSAEHPVIGKILQYRSFSKLKNGYVDALPEMVSPKTGRLHTSFNQAVTATGRLSSSDPNLQNIPIKTPEGRKIRAAFVAESGSELLSADYSQIELRILAHLSEDPKLLEAFHKEEDIHTRTASEVFGVARGLVTSEMRSQAKVINFGILYGMGANALAAELGISRSVAAKYIESYFERYAGVKAFLERSIEEARRTKRVSTLGGRRREVPDIASDEPAARAFAERVVMNTPMQGSAADLMKVAMIRVHRRLASEGLRAVMILQVHDELVLEAPCREVERAVRLVREEMEGAMKLEVPLRVDVARGTNWAELKSV